MLVGEVGAVAAELAGGAAERVQHRIAGVAGFEGQIEGLAEVLGEEAEGIDALHARGVVGVFENLLPRALQLRAERGPRRLQRLVVGAVTESH